MFDTAAEKIAYNRARRAASLVKVLRQHRSNYKLAAELDDAGRRAVEHLAGFGDDRPSSETWAMAIGTLAGPRSSVSRDTM